MKQIRLLMGMPITVEIVDSTATQKSIEDVFKYFVSIDNRFSTYKKNSEISKINKGEIDKNDYSPLMQEVFRLSKQTKKITNGYFNIVQNKIIDPSGLVKGWAIQNAANILKDQGYKNYYVEAGGDIQVNGKNNEGEKWRVGIKNPFNQEQIVKVVELTHEGIATSGTYIRGQHIYDPHSKEEITNILSLTVIGPNIFEVDRFATAAFAMGKNGIEFIHSRKDLEGYMIDKNGIATYTSGFEKYILK